MTDTHPTIEEIAEFNPEAVTLDGLDDAIIGIIAIYGNLPILMYSVEGIIKILKERDGMTDDEAREFFDFNIAGLCAGEYTPALVDAINLDPILERSDGQQTH